MAINYTPLTDFLTKDTLPKEDPDKVILGADFDAEFNAISTAFAGAAPTNNPTFTGTATFDGVTVNTVTISGLATLGGLDISGNATVGGTLDVTGNATFTDVAVSGSLTVAGEALPTFDDVNSIVSGAELGPISSLDDLSDVNVSSVTDGQTIVWDDTNSEWIPLSGNLFLDVDANSVKADSFVETHKSITNVMYCNEANNFSASLTGSTLFVFANVPAVDGAYACTLKLTANGHAVTWPAGTVWPGAEAPTLSAGVDIFVFYTSDGGTTWYGFTAGQEIA